MRKKEREVCSGEGEVLKQIWNFIHNILTAFNFYSQSGSQKKKKIPSETLFTAYSPEDYRDGAMDTFQFLSCSALYLCSTVYQNISVLISTL